MKSLQNNPGVPNTTARQAAAKSVEELGLVGGDFVSAVYENELVIGRVPAVTEEPSLHATHPYTIKYMPVNREY